MLGKSNDTMSVRVCILCLCLCVTYVWKGVVLILAIG